MAIERLPLFLFTCDTDGCGEQAEWLLWDNQEQGIRYLRDNGWGFYRKGRAVKSVACPDHNDFDNGGE